MQYKGLKHGSYVILGVGITLFIFSVLIASKYASDTGLVIQMNTVDPEWQAEKELRISFDSTPFSKLLTIYKVKIANLYHFELGEGRITIVTYKIYSNDVYVDEIRHSFDSIGGDGKERYDPVIIPPKTLKLSENSIRVVISIDSKATETKSTADSFELRIDSFVTTDNNRLTAVILFTLIPLVAIYEKWYRPRKN